MAKTKKLPNPESTDIEEKAKRDYKDTLFRFIFKGEDDRSKRWLLSLYNAINDSNYTNINDLQITTIQNALFLTMKDDLSFLIDSEMNLFEHQSTVNPNMLNIENPLKKIVRQYNFLGLWAREPVKICSEAKYFHNKPPAMRVRDKSL